MRVIIAISYFLWMRMKTDAQTVAKRTFVRQRQKKFRSLKNESIQIFGSQTHNIYGGLVWYEA